MDEEPKSKRSRVRPASSSDEETAEAAAGDRVEEGGGPEPGGGGAGPGAGDGTVQLKPHRQCAAAQHAGLELFQRVGMLSQSEALNIQTNDHDSKIDKCEYNLTS